MAPVILISSCFQTMIDEGYTEFAERWKPILDRFQKVGVKFCLEAHPTEIAFDIAIRPESSESHR